MNENIFIKILNSLEDLEYATLIAITNEDHGEAAPITKVITDNCYTHIFIPIDTKDITYIIGHILWEKYNRLQLNSHPRMLVKGQPVESANPEIHRLTNSIYKVAMVNTPVLITGETGTGKEVAARAIHHYSTRRNGPFTAVNCGAIPHELMQSVFFGYEKGSFTGAWKRHIGYIESTCRGTLFLDEIGDLPVDMQVCLLRFLESNTVQRLGGNEDIYVDVRVITATHINLEEAVANKTFRDDLYYRINVLHLKVPSLRERLEDLPTLANSILDRHMNEQAENFVGISEEAMECMRNYHWPGNIRELINRLRRAMILCKSETIRPEDLALPYPNESKHEPLNIDKIRKRAEKHTIETTLIRCNYNVSCAARQLGISRVTLYRLLDKHCINRKKDTPSYKRQHLQPNSKPS
ncbi:sigma-54 dependent transcriptional regulator [Halomonas sp. NO4]|uniref:sigma-54 interaction domain-containing protein n=1 Tax=Halomonas sp. NO4 TaxID=2484813 RepID=UPI0013D091BD|nr:sigma-54 dependent transcriptional regulator [Halomonas sp. NO4]